MPMLSPCAPDLQLRNVSFFKEFSEESLKSIAAITTERTFPANTIIFQEGDFGDALYIVKSGKVAIQKKDRYGLPVNVATFGEGEVIGDMALIDEQPRSATLITLTKTTFYIIQGSHFQLFLYGQREVTRNTLVLLSQRIRSANEKLIFNALDDHPDMIILTDKAFKVSHINKEAQQKLGIGPDLNGDSQIIANLKVLLSKTKKQAPDFEPMTWILLKPQRLYLKIHVSPMEKEEGAIFGYLLEFRDITRDRDRARRNLEVTSFIIHRISELVAQIKDSPLNSSPTAELQLDQVISEEILLRQIAKLVAFTEMEAGPLRIDRDLINPEKILEKIGENHRSLAEQKQQRIDFQLESGLIKLNVDLELIEKLFSLLIDNAIKYSAPGSRIKISSYQTPEGSFYCRFENPIAGCLNEDECEKFFDLGQQLDNFEKQVTSEFGLDLPLARHIIEAHHGKIKIEPNLENRFSVVVEIP